MTLEKASSVCDLTLGGFLNVAAAQGRPVLTTTSDPDPSTEVEWTTFIAVLFSVKPEVGPARHDSLGSCDESEVYANARRVPQDARTHPWSFRPGGDDVILQYKDGRTLLYDKVELAARYLEEVFSQGEYPSSPGYPAALAKVKSSLLRVLVGVRSEDGCQLYAVWDVAKHNTLPHSEVLLFSKGNTSQYDPAA